MAKINTFTVFHNIIYRITSLYFFKLLIISSSLKDLHITFRNTDAFDVPNKLSIWHVYLHVSCSSRFLTTRYGLVVVPPLYLLECWFIIVVTLHCVFVHVRYDAFPLKRHCIVMSSPFLPTYRSAGIFACVRSAKHLMN